MMRILIAPDKFKGTLSASQVAKAIDEGIKKILPTAISTLLPMADGGEGTLRCIEPYLKTECISLTVLDPLYRRIQASYLFDHHSATAYIEMAEASGLQLLDLLERDPLVTSSYGTGEMIRNAIARGARTIYLFVGGSSTNDGGMGMAQALGFRFFDKNQNELEGIGANLKAIGKIENYSVAQVVQECQFLVCTDVNNPLFGPNGAVNQYATQKGAFPEDLKILEAGLVNLCEQIQKQNSKFNPENSGLGAAGGIGAILVGLLNARISPATKFIFKQLKFENRIKSSDYVITGEGKYDKQTMDGKLVNQVMKIAAKYKKDCFIVCGMTDNIPADEQHIYRITSVADSLDDAMHNASKYIRILAEEIAQNIM